ncbi:hypothetical protein O3P69_003501 [Scylla paramamosain]|uniref:Ig-like domain-containing protein n=1 Tax=Scylla paramamosain TaxID=85552 RepID=A0AAW0UKU6_SCYPA
MPPPGRVSLAGVLTCLVLVVTSSVEPLAEIEVPRHTPHPPTTTPPPASTPITYRTGPRVDERHSGNVSSVLGRQASLRCRVVDRGNHTVSWIRHRDLHLLTVEQYTYTSDQRFKVSPACLLVLHREGGRQMTSRDSLGHGQHHCNPRMTLKRLKRQNLYARGQGREPSPPNHAASQN